MPMRSKRSCVPSRWSLASWSSRVPARSWLWDGTGPQPEILADLDNLRERITKAGFRGLLPGIDAPLARPSFTPIANSLLKF